MGRQPAYAIFTPMGDGLMVVRHNRHGGLLAALTGDRFLYPTRAPLELETSLRLADAGVPTPPVLGYAVYRSGLFARSDVATRMALPGPGSGGRARRRRCRRRERLLDLTATLLAELARAGARHDDLNAKNVLIGSTEPMPGLAGHYPGGRRDIALPTPSDDRLRALVIDVDRVTFGHEPRRALELNLLRLERSLRKLREARRLQASDEELAALRTAAAERL